ncbi:MAG: methionine synthase [Actinomycetes bacterium]
MSALSADRPPLALRPAAATALGSFPGTDAWEMARVVAGELGDLPLLAELPARGPGADMVGRTLGLLAGVSPQFSGQTTTTGWSLTSQRSSQLPRAMRRARAWLEEDLDAAQAELGDGVPAIKVQLTGPFTLGAAVELASGERLIADAGALRDVAGGLGEAIALHVADVARRFPAAAIVVQIDEPSLPTVLAGRVRRQSGWGALEPLSRSDAQRTLAEVFDTIRASGATPAVHCCGRRPPVGLFADAGAQLVSVDLTLPDVGGGALDEECGELFDSGRVLFAGLVRDYGSEPRRPVTTASLLAPLLGMLGRLSIPYGQLAQQLVVTPTCGLAGAGSVTNVRAALDRLSEIGRALRDEGRGDDEDR